jgi:hypothetical protein
VYALLMCSNAVIAIVSLIALAIIKGD